MLWLWAGIMTEEARTQQREAERAGTRIEIELSYGARGHRRAEAAALATARSRPGCRQVGHEVRAMARPRSTKIGGFAVRARRAHCSPCCVGALAQRRAHHLGAPDRRRSHLPQGMPLARGARLCRDRGRTGTGQWQRRRRAHPGRAVARRRPPAQNVGNGMASPDQVPAAAGRRLSLPRPGAHHARLCPKAARSPGGLRRPRGLSAEDPDQGVDQSHRQASAVA